MQDFTRVEQVTPAWHPASGAPASDTLVFNISSGDPVDLAPPSAWQLWAPLTAQLAARFFGRGLIARANHQRLPERMPLGHVSRGLVERLVSAVG